MLFRSSPIGQPSFFFIFYGCQQNYSPQFIIIQTRRIKVLTSSFSPVWSSFVGLLHVNKVYGLEAYRLLLTFVSSATFSFLLYFFFILYVFVYILESTTFIAAIFGLTSLITSKTGVGLCLNILKRSNVFSSMNCSMKMIL